MYADFKHLGDQNQREKSCYVASEFIALSSKFAVRVFKDPYYLESVDAYSSCELIFSTFIVLCVDCLFAFKYQPAEHFNSEMNVYHDVLFVFVFFLRIYSQTTLLVEILF